MVERVQRRRGEDAGLTHPSAQPAPYRQRPLPLLTRERETRPHGTSESLGEAHHHRRRSPGEPRGRHAERDGGVPQPGAVQMHALTRRGRGRDDPVHHRGRHHLPARGVVGVFRRDRARSGDVGRRRTERRLQALTREQPVRRRDRPDLYAPVGGHARLLVVHQVGVGLEQQLGPGAGEQRDAGLVRLGTGGEEQRVARAEELRDALLEPARGRVTIEDIVADFGLGHRAAHPRRRPRDRVAPQIDRRRGHPSCTRCNRRKRTRSYISATSPPSRNRYAV